MFKFLSHKLLNKKWLNACLLLGIILLVAVASCNPMFKNGALDMLMSSKFDAAMVEQNKYPATIGRSGSCAVDDYADADAVLGRIGKYEDMWNYYMEIDALQKQTSLSLQAGYTQSILIEHHLEDIESVYWKSMLLTSLVINRISRYMYLQIYSVYVTKIQEYRRTHYDY